MKRKINALPLVLFMAAIALSGCKQSNANTIRIGFFPNLTHSQAVYGYANGDYEKVFGEQYRVKWQSFNAGPAEIEAMFAGEVDIGYIGPIPAINGYIKSNGDVKIIAGAALNGAMLVTRKGLIINEVKELAGHTIAVPQFGNTQHLCLLNLLSANGLSTIEKGGNVKVIESSNPDTKTLMDKGDIDAALVPEPWATRLIDEIGVNVLLGSGEVWDAGDYSTAVVVVSAKFYEKNKDLVKKFLQTHIDITEYINEHPEEAMKKINDKIGELTGS
ncbi:MAG: ABC transporter substrate-binding protein, partial [Firmicutes bacterium]|nr:ABC transporter substrate-binding protein [Bacillota bacterium]